MGMGACETFCEVGLAGKYGIYNSCVLGPDAGCAIVCAEDEAQGTHELRPLLGNGVRDFGVAGKLMEA